MGIELQRIAEVDKAVLANLLQLYRYDMSRYRGLELTDHGTFVYRFLDLYFVEAEHRDAYLIRHEGELAGFAMTRPLPDSFREMSEFFVARAHRRRGVGRRAAKLVFEIHPGSWEVAFDTANEEAAAFWPGVVAAAASSPVAHREARPPERSFHQTVLRFSST